MKKALCVAILLAMTISGLMGTTAWAVEEPAEVTAFERQILEKLTVHQFMKTARVGFTKMTLFHGYGEYFPLQLEAAPYINADGALMVTAEDLGRFLGWGKTRTEVYWDADGKRVEVQVENKVEWDRDTGKIKIEVPWQVAVNLSAKLWAPHEEEGLEPCIEMTVGSNIWRYGGYAYIARTNCEERDGRVYLPIKDIHQTLLDYSQYYWDVESKMLVTVEGYRE